MKYKRFIEKYNLGLELSKIPFRTDLDVDWGKEAKHFAYKIYVKQGERFNQKIYGFYSQGSAIKGLPTLTDILNSLNIDTQGTKEATFESFASDFGYDVDSRKAYAIYEACIKESQHLEQVLGTKGLDELHNIETL